MKTLITCGFLLAVYIHQIEAREAYIARIPNGDSVPNTCATDQGNKWTAIGHVAIGGGGARNPFGNDFHENGLKWDQTLCEKDSDGDGRTNGQELGDPDCQWSAADGGSTPAGAATSNPAICEPVDSEACKARNDWLTCDAAATAPTDQGAGGDSNTEGDNKPNTNTEAPVEKTTSSATTISAAAFTFLTAACLVL